MKPDLYLHIGTEKTGTTSIQRFLGANREVLGSNGILYPLAPGKRNHLALTVAAADESDTGPLRKLFNVRSVKEVHRFRETFVRDLSAEIGSMPYRMAIMSGEHCSSRLTEDAEVERLRDMLSPLFNRIFIVVYIRRQDDYLLSTYSTTIKSGRTQPLAIPTGKRVQLRYNHWDLLNRWERAFGRDRIVCQKFERAVLKNGDVIADFLQTVGVDESLPFEHPQTVNESLDANTLEFLRIFNAYVPRFVDDEFNSARDNLVRLLNKVSGGPLPTLPEDKLQQFMSMFRESNRRVAEQYFGGELKDSDDPLFARRSDKRDRAPAPQLTVERAVEISACLWQQKQAEIERLEKRLAKRSGKHNVRNRRKRGLGADRKAQMELQD